MADDKTSCAPQESDPLSDRTPEWGAGRAGPEAAVKTVGVSAAAVARQLGK